MGDTPCKKKTFSQIAANLVAQAWNALIRALCNQVKALVQVIVSLLQVQASIVLPVVELGAVFVENFIVFPLQAVNSTAAALDNGVTRPLNEMGIDRSCESFKRLHDTIDWTKRGIHSLHQDLDNLVDTSQHWVDDIHDLENSIQDSIETMNELNNIVQCQ